MNKENLIYAQDNDTLKSIAVHCKRLGNFNSALLEQLIGVCQKDHIHRASCDRISSMLAHLNKIFDLYQIWLRVDSEGMSFSAINFESNARFWFRLSWQDCGELQKFFL